MSTGTLQLVRLHVLSNYLYFFIVYYDWWSYICSFYSSYRLILRTSTSSLLLLVQIQLKTDGNNLISKFFSAKETKKEPSDSQEKTSCNTSVKPEPSQNLEEHKRDEDHVASSCSIRDNKSEDSLANCSPTASTCRIKRDREGFSSESEIGVNDDSKISSSSKIRKKGNLKTGFDNKSTLFSYFGRK